MDRIDGVDPDGRWRASARLFKAHGHGNDYLVFERGEDWLVGPAAVAAVCDRWKGPGGDGVVVVDASQRPFSLRMFNPDGSEFEKSGNGLRVTAAWLLRHGHVGSDPFDVVVGGERVGMQIHGRDLDNGLDVVAEMGAARFGSRAVGLLGDEALHGPDGRPLSAIAVSMGNPHYVVFGTDLSDAELASLGPWISTHPRFERGTNVQLARVEGERLRIRIWERGVGPTSSSGTSACAAAAAAVHTDRLPAGSHTVVMDGGTFQVDVGGAGLRLRGPVYEVMSGALEDAFLRRLGGRIA